MSTPPGDPNDFNITWDDKEITEIVEKLNITPPASKPWLDFYNWSPRSYKCDCGGTVAKTTHVEWCSSRKV